LIAVFGTSLWVFIGLTVILFGAAAWMAGQALGETWRPAWQLLPYGALLAAGDRFFDWALFDGALLSAPGYGLALVVLLLSGYAAFRVSRARRMVAQYPWLYERAGPFAWRGRSPG
jgi:hypothetical protein